MAGDNYYTCCRRYFRNSFRNLDAVYIAELKISHEHIWNCVVQGSGLFEPFNDLIARREGFHHVQIVLQAQ